MFFKPVPTLIGRFLVFLISKVESFSRLIRPFFALGLFECVIELFRLKTAGKGAICVLPEMLEASTKFACQVRHIFTWGFSCRTTGGSQVVYIRRTKNLPAVCCENACH